MRRSVNEPQSESRAVCHVASAATVQGALAAMRTVSQIARTNFLVEAAPVRFVCTVAASVELHDPTMWKKSKAIPPESAACIAELRSVADHFGSTVVKATVSPASTVPAAKFSVHPVFGIA